MENVPWQVFQSTLQLAPTLPSTAGLFQSRAPPSQAFQIQNQRIPSANTPRESTESDFNNELAADISGGYKEDDEIIGEGKGGRGLTEAEKTILF
jgi:hypothetical protein